MQCRQWLIHTIFDSIPRTYKGITQDGDHIIQVMRRDLDIYATLEKLSNLELKSLANEMSVAVERELAVDRV